MRFSTLFFDLDETLYSSTTGLWPAIRDRMSLYLIERLGLPAADVPTIRRTYYETYGTTLRGLQRHHQVDSDEYLAYVHDLPLEKYLQPDSELRELLCSLPQSKWIFTNADSDHAGRVLKILKLDDLFTGIIDVRATGFACKPETEAYRIAMRLAGETDPQRCVLFDDSPRNLAPAHELGFSTVLVGSREPNPASSAAVERLVDLPSAMPDLWS